jgi:hypothetical protein
MTQIICKFCGRAALAVAKGDVLLVGTCEGCGASQFEMRQVFPQVEQQAPRHKWLSSGSGMQPDMIERWHGPLISPRPVEMGYTIR